MDLLERYLSETRRHLGRSDDADDVLAEISDELQSRIETCCRQLGRPLTDDDIASILADFGHPRLVAFRHQPQRSLIGPLLYPFYVHTLKVVTLTFIVLVLVGSTLAAVVSTDPLATFLAGASLLWPGVIYPIAVLTVMFAIGERFGLDETLMSRVMNHRWDPRTLPAADAEQLSPVHLLIEAFVFLVGALWLFGVPVVRVALGLSTGSGISNDVIISAAWHWFFVALFAATALMIVADIFLATRPMLTRVRPIVLIIANAIYLVGVLAMVPSGAFLRLVPANATHAGGAATMNSIILWTVAAFALICIAQIVGNVRLLMRRSKLPPLNIAHA